MADKTIGDLPALATMETDTLIPVEHDGSAKSMSGGVLGDYVYGLVEADVAEIAQGPQGDPGISPALSSTKSGKVTTIYYTDATHPTQTVLATLNDGADGTGVGDMVKATYDTNNNGIVDDAEKLGGYGPSHYATLDSNSKVTATQATAYMIDISSNTTLADAHNGRRLKATGSRTITVPSTLSAGFECEIVNYGTGTITIAVSGSTLNGTSDSRTLSNKYDVAVLAALTATDWLIKGDV